MLVEDVSNRDEQLSCPECGELCSEGLLRCWNCGSFLRSDIAQAYEKLRRGHSELPTGYLELPIVSMSDLSSGGSGSSDSLPAFMADLPDRETRQGNRAEYSGLADDDDDFELGEDVNFAVNGKEDSQGLPLTSAADDDFEDLIPPEIAAIRAAEESDTVDEIPAASQSAEAERDESPTEVAAPSSRKGDPRHHEGAPHSEATAGDVLLEIAKSEEQDLQKMRRERRKGKSFMVYCPRGCRILVEERHRGKTGRCPRCQAVFVVPLLPTVSPKKPDARAETSAATAQASQPRYQWLTDIHLHMVQPQKLRLKADALLNDFQEVDLGLCADGMIVATLVASGGLFGKNAKKKAEVRTALQDHVQSKSGGDGLPGASQFVVSAETLKQIILAQPTPPDVESLFGEIPIFGKGRIAVRLPKMPHAEDKQVYLSFSLTEFRQFSALLESVSGLAGFGEGTEVPLTDSYETHKCHYSDVSVKELLSLPYYEKDPALKLETVGWRCAGCSLIVSEDARKKEKIGGLNGKGIAKAKCPKCKQKFGNQPLQVVVAADKPAEATTA